MVQPEKSAELGMKLFVLQQEGAPNMREKTKKALRVFIIKPEAVRGFSERCVAYATFVVPTISCARTESSLYMIMVEGSSQTILLMRCSGVFGEL